MGAICTCSTRQRPLLSSLQKHKGEQEQLDMKSGQKHSWTCSFSAQYTLAASDPADAVIHRAQHLLYSGFGMYGMFKNNCKDFAIYCKTGLLVETAFSVGRSGQLASLTAAFSAVASSPLRFLTTSGWAGGCDERNVLCGAICFRYWCSARCHQSARGKAGGALAAAKEMSLLLLKNAMETAMAAASQSR